MSAENVATPEVDEVVTTETPVAETTEPVADLSTVDTAVEVVETSTVDLAAQESDRCKKIRALCEIAGCSDKFNTFVDAGFSVEETQGALKEFAVRSQKIVPEEPAPEQEPDAKYKAEYAERKASLTCSEDEYVFSRRVDDGLETLL